MQNHAGAQKKTSLQTVTQFELSNLIRKARLFSKIKLAPSTRLVLESLVYHYPNIRVNIETLEEETGCSRKSINNAFVELKENGLILITQTGRSNIFNLTQKFFDLLEVTPLTCKKEQVRHANITLPHNKEEKKEIKKDFQKISNLSNYQQKGIDYPKFKPSKTDYDTKSPMNDRETALKFIQDLSDQMNNSFIKMQVERVKKHWKL